MNTIVNVPASQESANSEKFREFLKKATRSSVDPFIVQPYTIILEQELKNDRSNYVFSLKQNGNSDRPLEVKLSRNDLFLLTAVRLAVAKEDTTTDPKQYANYPGFTYPEYQYFVGNNDNRATQITEGDSLQVLWNGLMSIKTTNTDRIKDYSTTNFLYSPERAYADDGATPPIPTFPQQGVLDGDKGYQPIMPQPMLDGQQDNSVILTLGEGDYSKIAGGENAAGTAIDTRNVVKVFLKGFIAVNAAQPGNKWLDFL